MIVKKKRIIWFEKICLKKKFDVDSGEKNEVEMWSNQIKWKIGFICLFINFYFENKNRKIFQICTHFYLFFLQKEIHAHSNIKKLYIIISLLACVRATYIIIFLSVRAGYAKIIRLNLHEKTKTKNDYKYNKKP